MESQKISDDLTTTTDRSFITVNRSPYFMVKIRRKYGETVVVNSSVLVWDITICFVIDIIIFIVHCCSFWENWQQNQ